MPRGTGEGVLARTLLQSLGMIFRQLFDKETSTYTYLLADELTRDAVLIDPTLSQVDRDQALLRELGLTLRYTLETHVHADHVTGGGVLRTRLGSRYVVSKMGATCCADVEVVDGDRIEVGHRHLLVQATPGHTDGCVMYVTDDGRRAFTGDALLIRGCGRTDFQQGDARLLYQSVHGKVLSLADDAELYPGHDYCGRTVTTVGEERAHNPRLGRGKTENDFVEIMNELDLAPPKHIDVAVPANLRCGVDEATWLPITRTADATPEVSVETVTRVDGDVRLIDVRCEDEFEGELGHVGRSELVPLTTLPEAMASWNKRARYVLICHSGVRSATAARIMENAGFEHVASMAGGMVRWSQCA